MALKKTVSLFQKNLIIIIENCVNKRSTNTKEVLDILHSILEFLEDTGNIIVIMGDINSQPGFYNSISKVDDFMISIGGQQQQNSACTLNFNTIADYHNSFFKNSFRTLYGYGRSIA